MRIYNIIWDIDFDDCTTLLHESNKKVCEILGISDAVLHSCNRSERYRTIRKIFECHPEKFYNLLGLPGEIDMAYSSVNWSTMHTGDVDAISDYISDSEGYCHKGFSIEYEEVDIKDLAGEVLDNHELGGVELTDEDIDIMLLKANMTGSITEAVDEYLDRIADTLSEGWNNSDDDSDNEEGEMLHSNQTYSVTLEIHICDDDISETKMDEIIADAVYEAGGTIVNISEYYTEI